MNSNATPRRGFLQGAFGAAVAAVSLPFGARQASAQTASPDAWLKQVRGTHRTLFDFPQHKAGIPLLHMLNYFNTYQTAYKTTAGQVGAVGTFYGIGAQASLPMAFNDAIWAKYALGDYTGLKDAAGRGYTRNVFHRPTANDLPMVMQAMQTPTIPGFREAMPGMGIESLQKMGTTFLLCANALGAWCQELEARGKGKAPEIEKELRAGLLPGVVVVPAMVIAIELAQNEGIRYNRQ